MEEVLRMRESIYLDDLKRMDAYFAESNDYYIATMQELRELLNSNGLSTKGCKEQLIHNLKTNNIKCRIGYLAYSTKELLDMGKERNLNTKGSKYMLIQRLKKSDKKEKAPEGLFVKKESPNVLTGVDRQILLAIDDESLLHICMVNKYMRDFMYDEVFWNLRIIDRYGGVDMYKYKGNATYKTIYREVSKRNKYRDRQVAKEGYIPIFKYLVERGRTSIYYNDVMLMTAVNKGRRNVVLYISNRA